MTVSLMLSINCNSSGFTVKKYSPQRHRVHRGFAQNDILIRFCPRPQRLRGYPHRPKTVNQKPAISPDLLRLPIRSPAAALPCRTSCSDSTAAPKPNPPEPRECPAP